MRRNFKNIWFLSIEAWKKLPAFKSVVSYNEEKEDLLGSEYSQDKFLIQIELVIGSLMRSTTWKSSLMVYLQLDYYIRDR